MLPFVRAFTSIVAGLVRVPAGKFGILSLIGTVLYAAALSTIGYALGSTWQSVSHGLAVVGYVLFALIVLAIVGFIAYRWRAVRREDQLKRAAAAAAGGPGQPHVPGPGPGQPGAPGPGPGRPDPNPGPNPGPGPRPGERPRPHSHRAR
jgi:hypothetical protein